MRVYEIFRTRLLARLTARYRKQLRRIYAAPLPKPVPDSRSSIDTFARMNKQQRSRP